MSKADERRRGLSKWEKVAVGIIIILVLIIILLIFNEEIKEYLDAFTSWYESS